MAEHKILGYLLAIGLCIVAAIFWVIDDEKTASEDPETSTVAVAPPASSEQSEDAATTGTVSGDQIKGEPLDETLAGKVLVSTRPVQVLAAPSESASAMFGFPAGRPFRAISKQDGFVRIQDVRSGASGWIEEAALAPAPTKPVVAAPSSSPGPKSASSGGSKPSRARGPAPDTETAAAKPEPAPEQKRRGIFGGGGLFGGLFGGN